MKSEIGFVSSLAGIKFFEVDVTLWTGAKHRVNVNVSEMRRRGVTKNANGVRKVTDWLNSDAGKQYLTERLLERTRAK